MEQKKYSPLLKGSLLALLCLATSMMWASTLDGSGSDINSMETADLYLFLKNNVLSNMRIISGISAFILTSVACFSQNIGSVIMNNIALLSYIIFGGAIFIKIIESQGMLLPLIS